MYVKIVTFLCVIEPLVKECQGVHFFDGPSNSNEPDSLTTNKASYTLSYIFDYLTNNKNERRFIATTRQFKSIDNVKRKSFGMQQQDDAIKEKIAILIQQTFYDTGKTIKSLDTFREIVSEKPQYKLGFITSYIGRERQKMNDLFDVAVQYREAVSALHQLRVFDYIMDSNNNITVLVRQLAQLHISHRGAGSLSALTSPPPEVHSYHTTPLNDSTFVFGNSNEEAFSPSDPLGTVLF